MLLLVSDLLNKEQCSAGKLLVPFFSRLILTLNWSPFSPLHWCHVFAVVVGPSPLAEDNLKNKQLTLLMNPKFFRPYLNYSKVKAFFPHQFSQFINKGRIILSTLIFLSRTGIAVLADFVNRRMLQWYLSKWVIFEIFILFKVKAETANSPSAETLIKQKILVDTTNIW